MGPTDNTPTLVQAIARRTAIKRTGDDLIYYPMYSSPGLNKISVKIGCHFALDLFRHAKSPALIPKRFHYNTYKPFQTSRVGHTATVWSIKNPFPFPKMIFPPSARCLPFREWLNRSSMDVNKNYRWWITTGCKLSAVINHNCQYY